MAGLLLAAVGGLLLTLDRIVEANRERLLQMNPQDVIKVLQHWNDYFVRGADQPVIGTSEAELKSLTVAMCIIPGNDLSHPRAVAESWRNSRRVPPATPDRRSADPSRPRARCARVCAG